MMGILPLTLAFTFAYPWVLALAGLPLTWLIWRTLASKRRRKDNLVIPSLSLWSREKQGRERLLWLPPVLRTLAATMLIVALARPQAGSSHTVQASEGIAIQLLVDVSSSMSMNIKLPDGKNRSRMQVARELVEKFIAGDGDTLNGRDGDLLGLITFARYADTRSPLTFGHEALLQIVKDLDIQNRANEDGTAYGDALALAAARLQQLDDPEMRAKRSLQGEIESRVIILLTDGENNSGQHLPLEAAGLAQSWGCRVYCISLGDHPKGMVSAQKDEDAAVVSDAQLTEAERVLNHISQETGGIFRTAHDYDSLLSVYGEIDQMEQSRIVTRSYTRVSEQFWLPLVLMLAFFLPALVASSTFLRTIP